MGGVKIGADRIFETDGEARPGRGAFAFGLVSLPYLR